MKTAVIFTLIASLFFCGRMFGHEVPVHRAITTRAEQAAYNKSIAYFDFINIIKADFKLQTVINDIIDGSAHEDDPIGHVPTDIGGYRSLNHFYDPLTDLGLSETPLEKNLRGRATKYWSFEP